MVKLSRNFLKLNNTQIHYYINLLEKEMRMSKFTKTKKKNVKFMTDENSLRVLLTDCSNIIAELR